MEVCEVLVIRTRKRNQVGQAAGAAVTSSKAS